MAHNKGVSMFRGVRMPTQPIKKLEKEFRELTGAKPVKWKDAANLGKIHGVYAIYNKKYREHPLYIGSTDNFCNRFRTDLDYVSTLTVITKLVNYRGMSILEAYDFLKKNCLYRIKICRTKNEAVRLEDYAIWLLGPVYGMHKREPIDKSIQLKIRISGDLAEDINRISAFYMTTNLEWLKAKIEEVIFRTRNIIDTEKVNTDIRPIFDSPAKADLRKKLGGYLPLQFRKQKEIYLKSALKYLSSDRSYGR